MDVIRMLPSGLPSLAALMLAATAGAVEYEASLGDGPTAIVPMALVAGPEFAKFESYREYADQIAPILQENGWRRVMLKNPGGHRVLPGSGNKMRVEQWEAAKRDGEPWAIDADLRYFVRRLGEAGVIEVMYYLGTLETLTDPYLEGKFYLQPFVQTVGASPTCEVSFGFDALSFFGKRYPCWELGRAFKLIDELRAAGVKVHSESRPGPQDLFWVGRIDGSMALAKTDATIQRNRLPNAPLYGEVFRISTTKHAADDDLSVEWRDGATPVVRRWQTKRAADVLPPRGWRADDEGGNPEGSP